MCDGIRTQNSSKNTQLVQFKWLQMGWSGWEAWAFHWYLRSEMTQQTKYVLCLCTNVYLCHKYIWCIKKRKNFVEVICSDQHTICELPGLSDKTQSERDFWENSASLQIKAEHSWIIANCSAKCIALYIYTTLV